ncbi:MAG: transcriptional repressor [Clostridiales bacterium]|jgi:Fur family ferric uptake transcriptional regulator|nr:transcriptional repressor [Clostridiales bacterium]
MARSNIYNTKQGEAILTYIASHGGTDITVEQIATHFNEEGVSIGLTTIYRHLDKLEKRGRIRKLVIDGIPSACYRYIEESRSDGLNIKCDCCGKLYNLECGEADEFERHILNSHRFRVDLVKTIFYGSCEDCQNKT